MSPGVDAFAEILGLTAAGTSDASRREVVASSTVSSTVLSASSEITTVFPTRRELRAQYAATASAVPVRRANTRRKKRPTSRRSATRVSLPIAAPAYALPAASRRRKHPLRGLITIVAVGGLFASAGLPAYALTSNGGVTSAAKMAASTTQSLAVSAEAKVDTSARGAYTATTPGALAQQRSDFAKQANWDAYKVSGAQELGDDYPWFSELSNNQGGGLSPLNYFYRECVDFVAWRLNRDAGSTQAPFLYDWSVLTPNGGNASQWASNWQAHGWPTGTTPQAGAVAWFGGHVAYVNRVNDDGTVLLEEYNYQSDHVYGQRTIAATDVALYLYAPPR